jgi:hypothetical protein
MRLTAILCFKKMPNGKIWAGKHRFTHKPTEDNLVRLRKRFQVEEQNMFYLRHPYLTWEETQGYAKELGKHEKWLANVKALNMKPYRDHATLEDRLVAPLNVTNAWD